MEELSAEQRTVHVLLGCKACQGSGDEFDRIRREEGEHTFCLRCGASHLARHAGKTCGICSGKLYSEV